MVKIWMDWWLALLCATILVQLYGTEACFKEEKVALLDIKQFFILHNHSDPLLPSWVHETKSDCCGWEDLICDSASGHVISLSLDGLLNPDDTHPVSLNLSLFLPLKKLRSLNLSDNFLTSLFLAEEDYRTMSSFKMLETIDLSYNMFNASIMKTLSKLTSLKNLILFESYRRDEHSELEEVISNLANLSNLEGLILSSNGISGPISQGLCKMKNLRTLDLSDNQLEGLFPLSMLANHSKLMSLSIGRQNGNFVVETENPSWVPSFQLQVLKMPECRLNMRTGSIPKFLYHQHNLQHIDLSGNKLSGMFPNWLFFNNSNLESVLLDNNSLTGNLELVKFSNQGIQCNRTSYLDISNNNIGGQLPENINLFFPNLEYLIASRNKFTGEIPASFGNMAALGRLDLSNNNLTGAIPASFVNMSALHVLLLSNNNLAGEIPEHLMTYCTLLLYLDLSYNSLSGQIFRRSLNLSFGFGIWLLNNNYFNGTLEVQKPFTDLLSVLDISENKFSGVFPGSIVNLSRLSVLRMSGNKFQGAIPKELCRLDLVYLILSNNRFSGSIPPCLINMTNLIFLHLRENNLVGSIPKALPTSLVTLDLGGNQLSGSIPDHIYRLQNLSVILLEGNNLQGQLPNQLCQLNKLRALDLSYNKLDGTLPTCLWNTSLSKRTVYRSLLSGLIFGLRFLEEEELRIKTAWLTYEGTTFEYMAILDLSSNLFIGEIPQEIGDCDAIYSLNLSHNHLKGYIPESLHKLKQLESLDLSCNNFSGQIPPQLQELKFLAVFNVSYNNLTGKAPDKGQFATFDEDSYKGNPYLLWSIDNRGSANNSLPPPTWSSDNDREEDESVIDALTFVCSFAASYVTVLLVLVKIIWINPRWRAAWFHFIETCIYYCFYRFLKHAF